jgi:cold shock CspA family protein
MSSEYFYGAGRKATPQGPGKPARPTDPRGTPGAGRVGRIVTGQSHGFIRLRDGREVFFHRGDLAEGLAFNDLRVGDAVVFELLDDRVSGARALQVRRKQKTAASKGKHVQA